jgi:hypothetical protein
MRARSPESEGQDATGKCAQEKIRAAAYGARLTGQEGLYVYVVRISPNAYTTIALPEGRDRFVDPCIGALYCRTADPAPTLAQIHSRPSSRREGTTRRIAAGNKPVSKNESEGTRVVHLGLWRIVGSREGFAKFYLCSGRVTNIHVGKSLSTEKHKCSCSRSGERAVSLIRIVCCAPLPLAHGSCSPQNRTSICCLEIRRAVTDD